MYKVFFAGVLLPFTPFLAGSSRQPLSQAAAALAREAPRANPAVIEMALTAAETANSRGMAKRDDILLVIDYSRPSTQKRLWVFDLFRRKLLYEELVAHGRNSGGNRTVKFSNTPNSLMSSLGVFVTAGTYVGRNGYSLRLRGLEPGVNDRSMERAIVMHGAPYVNRGIVSRLGRLGRSWGCPAVRPAIARELIDKVSNGAVLFSYHPQRDWVRTSAFLRPPQNAETAAGG